MNKYFFLIFGIITFFSFYAKSYAQSYYTNFNTRIDWVNGWSADPWYVSSGYAGPSNNQKCDPDACDWSNDDQGTNWLVQQNYDWTNFTLDTRLQKDDKDSIGVVFRFQNRNNFYVWFTTHESYPSSGNQIIDRVVSGSDNDEQHLFIYKIKNGSASPLFYDVIFAPKFGQYDLNIKAIEDIITITYDGNVTAIVDSDPILTGKVGLYAYNNHYDYFEFLNIDVIDTKPPTISGLQTWVSFTQTELTGHKWDGKPFPSVSDDIDPSPELRTRLNSKTGSVISFPYQFPLGQTTIWYEAYDASGNRSWAQQIVEITKDVTPPVISGVGGNISLEQQNSNGTKINSITWPSAQDRGISVAVEAHLNTINGVKITFPYTFPLGLSRIYWTAADAYGNLAAQIQEILIKDTTPAFLQPPSDITQEANDALGNIVLLGSPQVFDICDASLTVSTSAPDRYRTGETFVTWLAIDDSGNSSLAMQKIIITDTTPPKFIESNVNNELPPSFLVPNSFESCVPIADVPLPSVTDLGTMDDDIIIEMITIDAKAVLGHECLSMSLLPYFVCWKATDELMNSSEACQYLAIRTPTLLFDIFPNEYYHQFWWSNMPVTFDIEVTGSSAAMTFQVKPNPDSMISDQNHLSITYSKEGVYENIMVTASDDENWGRQTIYPFGIDKTAPSVDLSRTMQHLNEFNQIQNLVFGENPRIVDIVMNDSGNISSGLDSYAISLSDGQTEYILSSGQFLKHKNASNLYSGPMTADFFRCNEDIHTLLCDERAEIIDLQKLADLKKQLSPVYIFTVSLKDVAGNETTKSLSFQVFDYYHALIHTIDKINDVIDSGVNTYEVEESLKIANNHLQVAKSYEAFSYHEGSYLRAEKAMTVLVQISSFLPADFFDVLMRSFFGDVDVFIQGVSSYVKKDDVVDLENDMEHIDTSSCYLMQARYYFEQGDYIKAMHYGRLSYNKLALLSPNIHEQLVKQYQAEQEPVSLSKVSNSIRNIEQLLSITRNEITETLSISETNGRNELEQVLDDLYEVSNTCILNLGIFNLSDYEFMNCYLLITRTAENLNKVEESLVATYYWKSALGVSLFTLLGTSLYLSPTSLKKIAENTGNLDDSLPQFDDQLQNAMQAYDKTQMIFKKSFIDEAFQVYLDAKCTMIDLYNKYYSTRNTLPNIADPKDTPLSDPACVGGETITLLDSFNNNPDASAGVDQIADEGQLVLLDATQTVDADGDNVSYRWEQSSGKKLAIENIYQNDTLFFAPYLVGHQSASLDFTIIADDGKYGCDIDTTTILIDNVNDAPIANAGSDTLALEGTSIILDASASTDMEYDVLHFFWQQTAGPQIEIADTLSAKTYFIAPLVQTGEKIPITLEVTVSDDYGGVSKDSIIITIIDITASTSLKPLICISPDDTTTPEDPACTIPMLLCGDKGVCSQCYKPCVKDFYTECDTNKIPGYENFEESCQDFLDNDCDGFADDEDNDCTCWNFSAANRDTLKNVRQKYITSTKDGWKQILPNGFDEINLITPVDKQEVYTFENTSGMVFGGSGKINSSQNAKDSIQTLVSFITELDPSAQIQLIREKPLLQLFGFSEGYLKDFSITFNQSKSIDKLRDFLAQKLASINPNTVPAGDDNNFVLSIASYKDNNNILFNFGLSPKTQYDTDTNNAQTLLMRLVADGNSATSNYFVETQCLLEKISDTTQTVQRGVDIVWIEDISGSIWMQLQTLQQAADNFALALQTYNIDWRIIVYPAYVRMKMEDFSFDNPSKTWIKRGDYFYTDISRFKQEVLYLPGRYGCTQVAPDFIVTQPASCIESPISTGSILLPQLKQAGILDPNRLLIIIMATDTRDHYLHSGEETIENFIQYYQSENAVVFAIFPMQEDVKCAEPAGKDPQCDQEYRRLVTATGGTGANICGNTNDIKTFLDTIPQKLSKIINVDGMVRFDDTPVLSTVTVFNENQLIPFSYTQGVYVNESDKILEYSDQSYKPQDEDKVSVFYQIWKKR